MPFPSIVFGFVIATLLGAIFHLWRDGGLGKLILYLILSWVGFFAGHILSNISGFSFWDIGMLHVGSGILGSAVFLFVGHWLSNVDNQSKGKQ